jgi:1-acyl-sn-glycerol-3-phosphate acyltransferase
MSVAVHPGATILGSLATCISGARVRWHWRPVDARPRIYFANHSSHLDALVLWAALPEPVRACTRPVAAQEYWQRSRIRNFVASRIFRSVFIPRCGESVFAGRAMLRSLLGELDSGWSLILFPEGGRGSGDDVTDFKSGLFQLCRERADLEAVPVYLESLNRVLPKGCVVPKSARSFVTVGAPLRLENGEGRSEFLARARQALRQLRSHP